MVIKNDDDLEPRIAETIEAKTLIPIEAKEFDFQAYKMSLYDMPGSADNRGPVHDIANAFNNYTLMTKVSHMKFLFVASWNSICGQGGEFVSSLNNFSTKFKSVENLNGKIAICITKVTKKIDLIKKKIGAIRQANHMLSENSKKILDFANLKVFILKEPENEGVYADPNLFDDIYKSIDYLDLTAQAPDFLKITI